MAPSRRGQTPMLFILTIVVVLTGTLVPSIIFPTYNRSKPGQQVLMRLAVLAVLGLIAAFVLLRPR